MGERQFRVFGTTKEGLSLGRGAKQFNPLLRVEMRRWRARPLTYGLFVLLAVTGLVLNRELGSANGGWLIWIGLQFPNPQLFSQGVERFRWLIDWIPLGSSFADFLMGFDDLNRIMVQFVSLMLRPSTIIPILMVWRALVSFRESGYYNSLRQTFLEPRDFIWGIVTIPFWISALILVLYVGLVLTPDLAMGYYATDPERRLVHPFWVILGILFEGSMNGGIICFVALYLGLLRGARVSNLFPVLLLVILMQFVTALYMVQMPVIHTALLGDWVNLENEELSTPMRIFVMQLRYLIMGLPKLLGCVIVYHLCLRLLKQGMDLDATPR
ncbi:MAG: hypothetical protein SFY68_15855 [Candidatus Sumerlaeia bacterium]|nr:hypothetical protein [Candidatus Sumerlaeia bacterium]